MKEKTKERILKIVHIISYVMSALFIILCISLGLGSCNARKSAASNRVNERQERKLLIDNAYSHTLVLKSDFTGVYEYERINLSTHTDIVAFTDNCKIYAPRSNDININFTFRGKMAQISNESDINYIDITYLNFYFWHGANENSIGLSKVRIGNEDNGYFKELFGSETNWAILPLVIYFNDMAYEGSGFTPYPEDTTFNTSDFLSLFTTIYSNDNLTYTFDTTKINPIEFYEYEILSTNVVHNTGSYTGHIDLDMVFISNGFLFKGIRFQYDYVLGVWANEELTTYNDMTYLALSYIAYQDYYSDNWIRISYPRIYKYESRTLNNNTNMVPYPMTDFNTYLWSSDTFKTIDIITGSSNVWTTQANEPLANLTNWQILNYKNDLNNNMTSISGIGGFNVFTLLGSAFSSITTLFTLQVLPGISFGLLLFLPLIVGIIIAVIWLVKR